MISKHWHDVGLVSLQWHRTPGDRARSPAGNDSFGEPECLGRRKGMEAFS